MTSLKSALKAMARQSSASTSFLRGMGSSPGTLEAPGEGLASDMKVAPPAGRAQLDFLGDRPLAWGAARDELCGRAASRARVACYPAESWKRPCPGLILWPFLHRAPTRERAMSRSLNKIM